MIKKMIYSLLFSLLANYAFARKSETIQLFQEPEAQSKLIKLISPNEKLVIIYKQKEWLKVGVRRDGAVGWVNKKQYHEAFRHYYQENFDTFIIQKETNTSGELDTKITAYINGKRVSDDQAEKMYKKLMNPPTRIWSSKPKLDKQLKYMNSQNNAWTGEDAPSFMRPIIVLGGGSHY